MWDVEQRKKKRSAKKEKQEKGEQRAGKLIGKKGA